MNTQRQLLTHAVGRIHRTGNIGVLLAILAGIHAMGAWLAINSPSQSFSTFVVIVPSLAWTILFASGRKCLTCLPITLHQYEISRWWFVFVLPALFFNGITVLVYVMSAWLGAQPSAEAFWLYLLCTLGLIGLLAALTNSDLTTGSERLQSIYYNASIGANIAYVIALGAIAGLPAHGHWIVVLITLSSLGLLLGVSYPLIDGMSWVRSASSPINRSMRDVWSLLGFNGGVKFFLGSRALSAAFMAGVTIAGAQLLLSGLLPVLLPTQFTPKTWAASTFATVVGIVWLAHFNAIGSLREFRLLPISLTQLATAMLAFSWLPTMFLYLWIYILPGAISVSATFLLAQCALIASAQALLLPTLIKNYNTRFGWLALPRFIGIMIVHAIVAGLIAPRIAEHIDPLLLTGIFLSVTFASILWIRRTLTTAFTMYRS